MTDAPPNRIRRLISRYLPAETHLKARLVWSGIGSATVHALNRVLALGSGIVLARALGAEGYGVYSYAFAIFTVLMIGAEAGMPMLLMREMAAGRVRQQWDILRGAFRRAVEIVLGASALLALAGLLGLFVFGSELEGSRFYTTLFMLLILPIAATAKTVAGAIRGLHRVAAAQSLEMLLQPALMLVTVLVIFALFPDLRAPQYAMLVQLVTVLILLFASLSVLSRSLPAEVHVANTQYPSPTWMRSAIPFTLIGGAGVINNQADIIMLGFFRPVDEVGIYRVTSQSAMLVGFLLQAAAAVAGPHFSTMYAQGQVARISQLLKKTALLVTLGSLPVVLLFIGFGADILGFVFGDAYRSGWTVLSILAVGFLINISFGPVGMLLQMIGQEKGTARILWQTAALNLVLNAILIPALGQIGAAISTAVCVSLYHFLLRRLVRSSIGI